MQGNDLPVAQLGLQLGDLFIHLLIDVGGHPGAGNAVAAEVDELRDGEAAAEEGSGGPADISGAVLYAVHGLRGAQQGAAGVEAELQPSAGGLAHHVAQSLYILFAHGGGGVVVDNDQVVGFAVRRGGGSSSLSGAGSFRRTGGRGGCRGSAAAGGEQTQTQAQRHNQSNCLFHLLILLNLLLKSDRIS